MRLPQIDFDKTMIVLLVAGCVIHPGSAAAGLLILASAKTAERYFTKNISDQDRRVIATIKADVDKISAIQQKDGLVKAFGVRA